MEQHARIIFASGRSNFAYSESLIRMFSPPAPPMRVDPAISPIDRRALWSDDAVHRARNLAQLAAAVAHFGARARDPAQDASVADADALAAAYAELAGEAAAPNMVPCADLLTRVACGLVLLFGSGERAIGLRCAIDALMLPSERRRTLVLIASELIINALKYAFPERGGTIAVSLTVAAGSAELTIEDDGAGLTPSAIPGTGSRILDEMAMLLRAPIERAELPGGGLRVSLRMPL